MVLLPIEMPKNCIDCPCHNGDMQFCQFFMDREDDYDYMLEEDIDHNRRDNCPLVEMPTHKVMSMSEQELKEFRRYINGDWEITMVDK